MFKRIANSMRLWRRNGNSKNNIQPSSQQLQVTTSASAEEQQLQDLVNQTSASMSFNDEEYAKALTNEQIEDCKEAFAIFVDTEGKFQSTEKQLMHSSLIQSCHLPCFIPYTNLMMTCSFFPFLYPTCTSSSSFLCIRP